MAIDLIQWQMIVAAKCTGRALSAGYPDLLVQFKDAPIRTDTKDRQEHHDWKHPMADSIAAFAGIGLALEVIDREPLQGCEIVVDLNIGTAWVNGVGDTSCESQLLGQYDLVIDPGTSEHCFNIPQALVNLADAVKVGGCISQALPMAMFNHGYWNVNPVALIDFYEANGFKIERMLIRHESGNFEPGLEPMRKRLVGVPEGAVNLILARRLERKAFRWPQQKLPK